MYVQIVALSIGFASGATGVAIFRSLVSAHFSRLRAAFRTVSMTRPARANRMASGTKQLTSHAQWSSTAVRLLLLRKDPDQFAAAQSLVLRKLAYREDYGAPF